MPKLCFNIAHMKKLWDRQISRRRLLGGAAAGTAALPVLHELVPHQGLHAQLAGGGARRARRRARWPRSRSGHLRRRRAGRPEGQRLRPARAGARLRHRHASAARAGAGARVGAVASDREIEVAPGRQVRGLDLQRPRARADAAGARGRAAADPLRQRLEPPAHDPLPRHPPRPDGRRARASAPATSSRAARPSTSSTPSRSACTSTTAIRRHWPSTSPRASTARS